MVSPQARPAAPPNAALRIFAAMAGNTFGRLFRVTSYGESHGAGIGVVVDGCPAGLEVDVALLERDLARRRPGQSAIVTQRKARRS